MNATTVSGLGRIAEIVLILVVAATVGLVAGNALNERADNGASGAAAPASRSFDVENSSALRAARGDVTRTASASFNIEKLSALQAARGDAGLATTNAGYPAGYAGGAAIPVSRTAEASFSVESMAALHATRGEYGAAEESDWHDRHPQHR